MSVARRLGTLFAGTWLMAASAAAQDPATSAMGQGEANINVRADIKMSIEGTRATPAERVQQLTDAVSQQLAPMRTCYYDLVAKRPTSVGALAIRITLDPGGGPPELELKETGGTEPALTKCVRKALEKAPLHKVPRPAAAIVTLQFDNTRARGQGVMEQRAAVADKVAVVERDGGHEADWTSGDGKVAFNVRSAKSGEAVEAVLRTLRDSYAGFADCRRRSEKDGKSPKGELAVSLQLQRGGKGVAKIGSSTVAHERAVPCVERVLKRLKFTDAPGGQRVDVKVAFSE
jgi:hypothetical protein